MHRLAIAHGLPVTAARFDVIEDPLLVAVFLFDVFADRAAQPLQPQRQSSPTGHHQWHGMAHVVIGLGQEGDVAVQADLAGQRFADHRYGEQRLTLLGGLYLQGVEKGHCEPHNEMSDNRVW
ncbi:hypothetical protein D3C78_1250720 [compost metagenome]